MVLLEIGREENEPVEQSIGRVALVVRDYDEAINFYVGILGFTLIEDMYLPEQNKRWVVVAPTNASESHLLLARAVGEEQTSRIGNQTGGRVFLFLRTDNFWRDFHAYRAKGVVFVRGPKEESYGTVAVFQDLYGNLWDLLQPKRYSGATLKHEHDDGWAGSLRQENVASVAADTPLQLEPVNLREKFRRFADYWSPKIVGELNAQQVKLVKFQGEFVWHKHDHEDELFLVVKGRFRIEFRDRRVWLNEGEFLIVPRGVEHRPVADEEVHVLLFEPA
jgi:mannose-6-phosphate isomerase-like protein (cupin superfamily)/uncharacterized glyoxalase superfamily protein PhnB